MTDRPPIKDIQPMPFEALTKLKGPTRRHIEQLWNEVKRNKAKIDMLEQELNTQRWVLGKVLHHIGKISFLNQKEPKE